MQETSFRPFTTRRLSKSNLPLFLLKITWIQFLKMNNRIWCTIACVLNCPNLKGIPEDNLKGVLMTNYFCQQLAKMPQIPFIMGTCYVMEKLPMALQWYVSRYVSNIVKGLSRFCHDSSLAAHQYFQHQIIGILPNTELCNWKKSNRGRIWLKCITGLYRWSYSTPLAPNTKYHWS